MYTVGHGKQVDEPVAALPAEALAAFHEVTVFLQVAPWNGHPFMRERPDSPMRTRTFGEGGAGMVTYLIVEYRRLVEIIHVVWYA
ncbi:hypothetical protein HTZ77_40490 [Nonomuraea sp. SMC257]|uniref:Uncharacterized protein n=1 Tax=Nonomuraea montanisoli TaxID=2741721 RepID=A0A7Y6M8D0_9ACTN|nr:hypothetical protein [Nonomuraea montanisoli]NUW37640.1 hypothetical protein [Nonomuraea montanisoli]